MADVFDTKSANPVLRKKLDRLARDGDYDWSLPQQIVDGLILKPLQDFDQEYADFVSKFIDYLRDEHISLLSQVSLDALSREEAAPLLIKAVGASYTASFLNAMRDQFGGPDLGDFLLEDVKPVDVVFQWGETLFDHNVTTLTYPDNKPKRDGISRWRREKTPPKFFASIRPLLSDLEESCPDRKPDISLFGKWLLTARALAWLDRETEEAGFGSLIELVRQEILLNCPRRDVGKELSIANIEAGNRLQVVKEFGLPLLNISLTRTNAKNIEDQEAARLKLNRFKDLLDQNDTDGRARYMLDWCEGRWHVLAGDEEKALKFYERASDLALYRAGQNQKQILQEALALAAHLGKKAALKRFKHRALAMRMFPTHLAEFPDNLDVISDWEVEQMAQAFAGIFPHHARFPEAMEGKVSTSPLPFRAFYQPDTDKIKPDLTRPDRVIGIPSLDGSKYRRPQLIWFASEDRVKDVEQLLEAGADVNKLDGQGGSALLNALQCAEDGRGRQALDLLLEHPHQQETLDRLTAKKRLSPLYMSIILGDPAIVARLIEMGASPDMPASYPPQSPLYVCIERFTFYRDGLAQAELMQRLAFPGPEDAEIRRRYTGVFAGVMGDQPSIPNMANPRHAEIMRQIIDHSAQKPAQVPRENYLEITKILLEHGADPNRKHSSPGPGRTPLMVAAENNAADAFHLLVEAGGTPYLKDDEGHDCHDIARAFQSREIMEYLSQ
ncbi:ankyrin repeat domain-containing protein [Magnetovibrio sp. PR-2]|uniref:ankyrin repeat domain-containing protein n=1 Tax=Magnetovibrio sp. PR-2 TaxID=3120356 RepID=UPI002FCE20D3